MKPWEEDYTAPEEFQLRLNQEWDSCREEWCKTYYIRSTHEQMGNKSYREDRLIAAFKSREDAEKVKDLMKKTDEARWTLENLQHNIECLMKRRING